MFYVFIIFGTVSIIVSKIIHNTYINPYSVLCAPYVFVVLVSKIYGEKVGFYPIGSTTLIIIGVGLLCFLIGTLIALGSTSESLIHYVCPDNSGKLNNYNMRSMHSCAMVITVIGLIKALMIVKSMGVLGLTKEGTLIAGPVGHLILMAYPLQPILFYYWLRNKKRIVYLLSFLLFLVILFCSFVKYHVISMMVITYLFVVLTEQRYLKKGIIFLIAFSVGLFTMNYVVGFISNNVYSKVQSSFYFNHFLKYILGAVINGDQYNKGLLGVTSSIGYKIMTFLMAVPNMFCNVLFGTTFFPHESMRLTSVSYIGEESNVTDAISYMYSSQSEFFGILGFVVFFLVFGLLIESAFLYSILRIENLQIFISTLMAFFLFFSFFGTFYVNSMPWEVTIYSAVIPQLFNNNARVKYTIGPCRVD